jgi:hypothetical protein
LRLDVWQVAKLSGKGSEALDEISETLRHWINLATWHIEIQIDNLPKSASIEIQAEQVPSRIASDWKNVDARTATSDHREIPREVAAFDRSADAEKHLNICGHSRRARNVNRIRRWYASVVVQQEISVRRRQLRIQSLLNPEDVARTDLWASILNDHRSGSLRNPPVCPVFA